MMENRQARERVRVMIVEQDLDFGIKLADWLAAHGYQPVLARTSAAAIEELGGIRPQAIFVGLRSPEPELRSGEQMDASEILLLIQTICPRVPVIPMADHACQDLTQVVVRQGVRRFLVKPVEFSQIGDVLQSELRAAGV